MRYFKSALAAATLSLVPMLASAAPIDIMAAGYELDATADKEITITGDGGDSGASLTFGSLFVIDLNTFSAFTAFDVTSAASYSLAFDADGSSTDTADNFTGGTDISLTDGALQVLFEDFAGGGVFAAVDALLVTFTSANLFPEPGGSFLDFSDAVGDTSTLRVQGLTETSTTPVPLPAGLPLMLSGMAGFVWLRRRKQS